MKETKTITRNIVLTSLAEIRWRKYAHTAKLFIIQFFIFSFFHFFISSCSSEQEPEPEQQREVEVMPCSTYFNEAFSAGTRGWIPPSGFSEISGMEDKTIGICFTQDGQEPKKGYFVHTGGKWLTSVEGIQNESYYLYGYVPHQGGVSCDITDLAGRVSTGSEYSEGAILTINNLPTITASDVCVLVGARNGYNNGYDHEHPELDYSITGLKPGDFQYDAKATALDPPTHGNCVFLLFDHLYSSLRVRLKVHATYDALRTIKLKKLNLSTTTDDEPTKKYTDISITLNKTTDGSSPIAKDGSGKELITYTQRGDIIGNGTLYESENPEGMTLTTSYQPFQGYFMPHGITTLIITSTYDIYDKNGNMTRKDCTAENTIVFSKLNLVDSGGDLFLQTEAHRGIRYTIDMTIKPTYLYMMSDPDLENPTVTLE
ncbi:MAG: hypothetical protein J6W52_00505 [Bacteroidaceae bacterium]|nr:hypothetical protein [Bacteroidaceae bacterium]